MADEFQDYLDDARRNPEFAKAFDRARRRPRWLSWLIRTWERRPW